MLTFIELFFCIRHYSRDLKGINQLMCNNIMRCRYFVISMDEETGHTSKEVVKLGFEIRSLSQELVILEPLPLPGFKSNYN